MSSELVVPAALIAAAGGLIGLRRSIGQSGREAAQYLLDTWREEQLGVPQPFAGTEAAGPRRLQDEYAAAGIFTPVERRSLRIRQRVLAPAGAAIAVCIAVAAGVSQTSTLTALALAGLAAGYLKGRSLLPQRRIRYIKQIEYFLPMVMERLVMAVQAGLEVLAAIQALLELEEVADGAADPVTRLMRYALRLTEAGLPFETSLRKIAEPVESPALKHAFIHLALAQREGGELTAPLKELSDSTQLYYQETVEEEIAKLPIKATLPLVCVFAGLVILFITPPLLQVMDIAGRAGG